MNSYNTITNNVIVGHALGVVFWYSGQWSTQALNDQSGLRYDVIANNTLVNDNGSVKWDASPAHVGTTIENNVFVSAAGTSPAYLLQASRSDSAVAGRDGPVLEGVVGVRVLVPRSRRRAFRRGPEVGGPGTDRGVRGEGSREPAEP